MRYKMELNGQDLIDHEFLVLSSGSEVIFMVKLKVGRNVFDIDKDDLILDNGACYILVTKKITKNYSSYSPTVSKKLFTDLKKCELIFTSEGLRQAAIKKYGNSVITFWKFNIDQMQKMGY